MHIFVGIILIVSFFIATESCTCVPLSQQDSYCRASWISQARIVGKQNLGNSIEYTVQHLQIFKSHTSPLPNKVFTPSNSATCGQTDLAMGQTYLLQGTVTDVTRALQLNTCLYMPGEDFQSTGVLLWSRVPAELSQRLINRNFGACPVTQNNNSG